MNAAAVRHAAAWALVATCSLVPGVAGAQQDANIERGFAPEKLYSFGSLDSINLFNGNLALTLPIGPTYRVNGALSYGLTLVYNSKVWDLTSASYPPTGGFVTHAEPNPFDNAGMGFRLSLGQLLDAFDALNHSLYWTYIGEDGAEHSFYPTLHIGEAAVGGVLYTRDGSYLRLKGLSGTVYEVEFPDGTVRTFTRASASSSSPFKLTQIRDRFGNAVAVVHLSAPTRWQISDGHRTHTVYFKTVANREVVDRVEFASLAGVATYTFGYTATLIQENCRDQDPDSPNPRTVPLLTSIALPADGGSFLMNGVGDYYTTCSDGGVTLEDLPGVLHRMKLPTLGTMEWTYQMYSYPSRGIFTPGEPSLELTSSLGVKTKQVLDAAGTCVTLGGVGCSWNYAQIIAVPTERSTRATFPTGDETVYHFSTPLNVKNDAPSVPVAERWTGWDYGLPYKQSVTSGTGYFLSQEIYDGPAAGGAKRRSLYVGYEHDKLPQSTSYPQDWYNTNRRVVREKTVFDDDSAYYADAAFSEFDGLSHYRRRMTGGNLPTGANVRTDYTAFNPAQGTYYVDPATNVQSGGYTPWASSSPWVIGTSTETWAQEGSATIRTQTCYEAANGFLAWTRTYQNGTSQLATDVLVRYTRGTAANNKGSLIREEYFGADPGGLPATTPTSTCALSGLPGHQYRIDHDYQYGSRKTSQYMTASGTPMSFFALNLVINAGSGLPTKSTDPAGVVTDYEYDALGRLTWAKPATGHGAWTEYAYTKATSSTALARVNVRQRTNGSKTGTILAESEIGFDALGRVAQDKRKLPGVGWTTVATRTNAMGWVFDVSERMTGTPSKVTKYLNYDPFGRPLTIRPPDSTSANGFQHDVTLFYFGVRRIDRTASVGMSYNPTTGTVSESPQTTREFYDRQGRLQRVLEPSVGGATQTETIYAYNPAGRLTQVTMRPQGGATVQTRTFNYDGRGFLKWENHPEKTANVHGLGHDVDYRSYDARGHAGRRIDGANDLTFSYDRAERLTQVRETGGLMRTLKSFTYGTSSPAGNWKNSKLETASRYNYVAAPFNATVLVTETYVYGGADGRVSQKATQMTFNGEAKESFTQGWAWTGLGRPASISYPQCTFTWCPSPSPRTVSFGYTDGILTSIAGFTAAAGITYHANGLVNQAAHANGVTDSYGLDPNSMRRPASISAAFGATTRWSSGAHAYDGAGNVVKTGTAWYLYDELSRIKTGTVFTGTTGGGTQKQQTYTYDPYGNLTNVAGNPDPGRSTPTSSTTNRLTSGVYDAAGNLTSWNGATYVYDGFNMMIQMVSGAEDWRYIYTADDERLWAYRVGGGGALWSLRDLDGAILRQYEAHVSWTTTKDYIYRDGQLFASVHPSVGTRHFHLDHLGTVRLITNASGTQTAYHVYYPFGEEATAFNQDTERMKFTGHERDPASLAGAGDDLDYMHARYCSPLIGRFLSVDPGKDWDQKVPQSWNLYSYVRDNPLKYTDPTGQFMAGGQFALLAANVAMKAQDFFLGFVEEVRDDTAIVPTPPSKEKQSAEKQAGAGLANLAEKTDTVVEVSVSGDLGPLSPVVGGVSGTAGFATVNGTDNYVFLGGGQSLSAAPVSVNVSVGLVHNYGGSGSYSGFFTSASGFAGVGLAASGDPVTGGPVSSTSLVFTTDAGVSLHETYYFPIGSR